MNRVTKLALINFNNSPFYLKASLFHSTPFLNRRRRTSWESDGRYYRSSSRRPNFNGRRQRKFYAKQEMLRNINAFAENLFQGCHERDEFEPSSSYRNAWFRNLNDGSRRFNGTRANSRARKKGFQFYEDDEEVETIFRSAFGSNAGFYFYSFINDESPRGHSSGYYNNNNKRASWNWRQQFEDDEDDDDEDDDDESERVETDLRKDRIALGLSGSGPLSLEDVKNAYRACALKWHPDRHNGSSKDVAEEKFKVCSAAYQSLCDKLAPN